MTLKIVYKLDCNHVRVDQRRGSCEAEAWAGDVEAGGDVENGVIEREREREREKERRE